MLILTIDGRVSSSTELSEEVNGLLFLQLLLIGY